MAAPRTGTSVLDAGELSASSPDRFTFGERTRGNCQLGGCIGGKTGVDAMAKGKILAPLGNKIAVPQPVT